MSMWIGLWLCTAALEVVAFASISNRRKSKLAFRIVLYGLIGIASFIASTTLLVQHWQIWLLPWLVGLYRQVNLLRAIAWRLQVDRLRTGLLRALGWLFVLQVVLAAAGGLVYWHHLGYPTLAVVASVQLLVALGLLRTTLQTWQHTEPTRKTVPALTDKELPSLSVLIPARNETDSLEACLQSLIASDYPKLEIIALDDCSSDRRTPDIIRQFAHDGVRFIEGKEPDEHWLAKTYAYQRLSEAASGELLLFCGVDVVFEPQTVRRLVELLIAEKREMLSVLPQRLPEEKRRFSLLQPMRYYWEVCFPRRLFKRPPVLSTCWLIRTDALKEYGGFAAVSHAITPEAHLAKKAVVADAYTFVRSTAELPLYSTKTIDAQYDTMIRVRYPQLHRRLEMVAYASLFELLFLLGPFLGLFAVPFLHNKLAFGLLWLTAALSVVGMYSLVAVQTRLNSTLIGVISAPLALIVDMVMLHNSMLKYEFGKVIWKERNICLPVMHVYQSLPELPQAEATTPTK